MAIVTTGDAATALEEGQFSPRIEARVAIAGLGAIGKTLVRNLSHGAIPGMKLVGVAAGHKIKARETLDGMSLNVAIYDLEELPGIADIVVECAPAAVFEKVVRPVLLARKTAIVLSAGALLSHPDLIECGKKVWADYHSHRRIDRLRCHRCSGRREDLLGQDGHAQTNRRLNWRALSDRERD